MILEHAELVKRIAYHLVNRLPASVDVNDLIQAGMLGLLLAGRTFREGQGASFETYAGIRIRGAMLDEVRRSDWTPRSVYRKLREIGAATAKIEAATGAPAKDQDIANELGVSLDDYHATLRDGASARLFSLDDTERDGDPIDAEADPDLEPHRQADERTKQERLADCIRGLPERERLVMSLYYDDELNMREIGEVLSVTESRVSQIHASAIKRLRDLLNR
ncbi:MAG: RNA polymerase sigma factor FliA [Pseudomonadota bacterium]